MYAGTWLCICQDSGASTSLARILLTNSASEYLNEGNKSDHLNFDKQAYLAFGDDELGRHGY
jgi:hypothetical protein